MVGENLFFYVLTSDTEYIEPVDKYFFFFGLSYTLHSVVASNFDIHFDLCFSLELFHWYFSLMVYTCVYIYDDDCVVRSFYRPIIILTYSCSLLLAYNHIVLFR